MKPIFAKRHYEAIAAAMQEAAPPILGADHQPSGSALAQWGHTVRTLAEMFRRDNPQFERARFERACQPGANVRARSARARGPLSAVLREGD